jgi:hypothetical protein
MAQIGNEVVERPPPGRPADEATPGELEALEALEEVNKNTFLCEN